MPDLLASLGAGLRGAFRREHLPPPSPPAPRGEAPPGVLRQLFAREELGQDPEPAAATRPGILAVIFGREPLGSDAPAPPRRRTNWIAFLTRPEALDD
jgi:hypothetical protein